MTVEFLYTAADRWPLSLQCSGDSGRNPEPCSSTRKGLPAGTTSDTTRSTLIIGRTETSSIACVHSPAATLRLNTPGGISLKLHLALVVLEPATATVDSMSLPCPVRVQLVSRCSRVPASSMEVLPSSINVPPRTNTAGGATSCTRTASSPPITCCCPSESMTRTLKTAGGVALAGIEHSLKGLTCAENGKDSSDTSHSSSSESGDVLLRGTALPSPATI